MADVEINQAFPSSAAPINAEKWDTPLQVSGDAGTDGHALVLDSTSTYGVVSRMMVPAVPVDDYADIPVGEVRFFFGGSPVRFEMVYNDNGNYIVNGVTP